MTAWTPAGNDAMWRALASRAVACSGWRWRSGMRVVAARCNGYELDFARCAPGTLTACSPHILGWASVAWDGGATGSTPAGDLLPILSDPATVGCLLDLVRAAWDEPLVVSLGHAGDDTGHPTWEVQQPDWDGPTTIGVGPTEAEALLVALEARSWRLRGGWTDAPAKER